MKLISLSLTLFLVHLQIFDIPMNYVYSYMSFIPRYLFLFSVSLIIVYFATYRTKRLSNLSLNNVTKGVLIIGAILSLVFFITDTKTDLEISHLRLLFLKESAFFFMILGFLLLFIQNQPKTNNNLKLYEKFIIFIAMVFVLTQLNLIEHLVSYIVAISLHTFKIDTTLSSSFLLVEGIKYTVSLILLGLFIIFSNLMSHIIYQKHNSLILVSAIIFYILWIIFTFHKFTMVDTSYPYLNDRPYWFLQGIANILFFTVFIRMLFFSNSNNTFK